MITFHEIIRRPLVTEKVVNKKGDRAHHGV